MHIVTLSFDDGFRKSNTKIAQVYERFGLRACFNVLAAPQELAKDQEEWGTDRGDWALWNELQARGHEIMPHGYHHANKAELPFAEAKGLIERCLAIFCENLDGFDPKQAVFNFPFNRSTPELEAWLPTVVRAFRTSGGGLNPLPRRGATKLTTTGSGPEDCGWHIDQEVASLLSQPEGWLVYNTHGVDGEGWGPITSDYLQRLLARLVEIEGMEVMPTGLALARSACPT
jgi:peptidoglycan/xylan/chitin deacetylase (PgdA/CDA1 family)